jgi:hypothetical protein
MLQENTSLSILACGLNHISSDYFYPYPPDLEKLLASDAQNHCLVFSSLASYLPEI